MLIERTGRIVALHPSADGERSAAQGELALGRGRCNVRAAEQQGYVVGYRVGIEHTLDDEVVNLGEAL